MAAANPAPRASMVAAFQSPNFRLWWTDRVGPAEAGATGAFVALAGLGAIALFGRAVVRQWNR